jgi:hypothetical protein
MRTHSVKNWNGSGKPSLLAAAARRIQPSLLALLLGLPELARAASLATTPLEVTTPYPTLIHLAVEWAIEGDMNNNGQVAVSYRNVGETSWREGMPLRRVPAGRSSGYSWTNKHSGTIFNLRPDTEYESHLRLYDPDGGAAERTVRARTRPVPRAMPDAPVRQVTSETFAAAVAAAEPGEILLLADGRYGRFTASRDGAPGRPLVIRSQGEVVFESIDLKGRSHLHLEGLTVNGIIDLADTRHCVIRRCIVNAPAGSHGIIAKGYPENETAGATNCYIADNVVTGLNPWTSEAMGAKGQNHGNGIQVAGAGNVICFNRVAGFRDCIATHPGEGGAISIDIYNNALEHGLDDAIEADYTLSNCRVVRNHIINSFCGLSSQPSLGGPSHFIRNVMYNIIYAPFKLHKRTQGNVVLHNTVVKTGDGSAAFTEPPELYTRPDGSLVPDVIIRRAFFRNNLTIGGTGSNIFGPGYTNGRGLAARWPTLDETCDFDFNGYGTHGTPFEGDIRGQWFDSLETLRSNTMERYGVQVSMSVFAANVPFPDPPLPSRAVADLRLRDGTVAIDAAETIPDINDNYTGSAPDLGAYEYGQPPPHYGPRPDGVDEEMEGPVLFVLGVDGGITLIWSGGSQLQEADTVDSASWRTIPNANSPHFISTTNSAKFFRIRQ